ncbi:MAG: aspartate--tRNA(Asn) ligase, partial [Candidatus Bathyarchaeota archaeon]|nr:aspartate--tRNA(Asn) ligase [Candidatus Bathyarchaeota archaeon]
ENLRDLGSIQFITLRDRRGQIQIVIPKKDVSIEVLNKVKPVRKQFVIGVVGIVKASEEAPRGVEIFPLSIKVLGESSHPLPLEPTGKIPADIDVRLNARILDLRRPECRAIFKIRHEVLKSIRNYLSEHDYMEVQTPRIIGAASEGGSALFPLKYFENEAYLAQSPELYKEELISVFEKVFEIGPFFRAEKSHTRRHLNEFISIDIEEAFATASDVMIVQEELVSRAIDHVNENCGAELEMLNRRLKRPELPFKRYHYSEILKELSDNGLEIKWGEDLTTEAYRRLGKLHEKEFYFITDWPSVIRPFYIKPKEKDPKICYAFDLMYEWIEITSGGARVESKELFIQRLKEQGLNPESFEFHLKTFDYGMPPHSGWGMGLDRFMMVLTGHKNVREVVLFPRDRFRLHP